MNTKMEPTNGSVVQVYWLNIMVNHGEYESTSNNKLEKLDQSS